MSHMKDTSTFNTKPQTVQWNENEHNNQHSCVIKGKQCKTHTHTREKGGTFF